MTRRSIRIARVSDAQYIQAVYAPFVQRTAVTFETDAPSVEEMSRRIDQGLKQLPWLVLEETSARAPRVLGYAYASRHRDRVAYQWSVETSVYLDASCHRSGAGRQLYTELFRILVGLGYFNAYAGITIPNEASVGFHEAMGFEPIGIYRKIGFKLGAWHDVGWWQLALSSHVAQPAAPRLFSGMDIALL